MPAKSGEGRNREIKRSFADGICKDDVPLHLAPDGIISPANPVRAGDLCECQEVERQLQRRSRLDILCLRMRGAGLVIIDEELPRRGDIDPVDPPRIRRFFVPSGDASSTGSSDDAGSSDASVPMPKENSNRDGTSGELSSSISLARNRSKHPGPVRGSPSIWILVASQSGLWNEYVSSSAFAILRIISVASASVERLTLLPLACHSR